MWDRGLFRKIDAVFDASLKANFGAAFVNYEEEIHGHKVRRPGFELREQLEKENLLEDAVAEQYAKRLKVIIDAASATTASPSYCCLHHSGKFKAMQGELPDRLDNWLKTILELVPDEKTLGQLKLRRDELKAVSADGLLTKLLRLNGFISANLGLDRSGLSPDLYEKVVNSLRAILAPSLSPSLRLVMLRKTFEQLSGSIGLYPSVEGESHRRWFYCPQTLVFSTFKAHIDRIAGDRHGPPDEVLARLGLTFQPGELWIEVSYHIDDVEVSSTESGIAAVIPTAIEARGYWPFKIDRDAKATSGYTRDLRSGGRGLPEIVHSPVSVSALRDAVIWGKPTALSWGTYASDFIA